MHFKKNIINVFKIHEMDVSRWLKKHLPLQAPIKDVRFVWKNVLIVLQLQFFEIPPKQFKTVQYWKKPMEILLGTSVIMRVF